MGPESKGAAFQHTNPLIIVPGIRKMKPICFMQGKRLVAKLVSLSVVSGAGAGTWLASWECSIHN